MAGCATPLPPTGGEPERTPPQIVTTNPAQGKTFFEGREVRFEFNRFMNRGSASRALRIEPDLGIEYKIGWKRKTMVITFEEKLPDSVTVIISLGTELSDVVNNRIGQPYLLAFSTGAEVDSAGVDIATVSFDNVRGEEGKTVGLFREFGIGETALYMAESDTSGLVRFRYATPGNYEAVLFEDRNRNRRLDEGERFFAAETPVTVASDSVKIAATITYADQDTIRPTILGVGLMSESRLRVRFSESVRLSNSSTLSIHTPDAQIGASWLYSEPSDATVAYAKSNSPLQPATTYKIRVDGVTDRQGNAVEAYDREFQGSSQPDTTKQRIIRLPDAGIVTPSDSLMVIYGDVLNESIIIDSLTVIDGDRSVKPWTDYRFQANRLYVYRNGGWRIGQQYQIRTWNPADVRFSTYTFRAEDPSTFGSVEIIFPANWQEGLKIAEIVADGDVVFSRATDGSTITIESIPEGTYSLRTWIDRNGNGKWDPPGLSDSGERVYMQRAIPVVSRMTSTIPVE